MVRRGVRRAGPLVAVLVTALAGGCHVVLGIEEASLWCTGKVAGTPLPAEQQVPGDCMDIVCDGEGGKGAFPAPFDADDGNPCTLDACQGATPVHTLQVQAACYSGPEGTQGIGVCKAGLQQCDAQATPVGACVGEVVPMTEICQSKADEDCDGQADEGLEGCVCGDGALTSELGEECDDGGKEDGDDCSPTCKEQRVLEVSAGYFFGCARLSGGVVKCWGVNFYGNLGLGDTFNRGPAPGSMGSALPAVDLGPWQKATAIAAGGSHACALLSDGSVKCWGRNDFGMLGLGDTEHRGDQPGEMGKALLAVELGAPIAKAIAVGSTHTCALLVSGVVKCWGGNYLGQLGLGDTEDRGDAPGEMGAALPAVDLGTGKTAEAIGASGFHTCALLAGGEVKCWGPGSATGDALLPVDLGSNAIAKAIAVGDTHACALLQDGAIKCWGSNIYGQLGLGDTNDRGDDPGEMGDALPAVDVGQGLTALSLDAGASHTCVVFEHGFVKCWGKNDAGQLGRGDTANRGDSPDDMGDDLPAVALGSEQDATAISVSHQSCALLTTGAMKCWGPNDLGALGLGDTDNRGDDPGEMGDALPTVKLFSNAW